LALNAKGGEINRPKKKDRTTTLFSFFFKIAFAKTLLAAKGRTFLGGAFILPKEKHLKKGRNAFRNNILIQFANCKRI
jgi:hypothetical protein